jgi:hypothetical protein
MFRRRSEGQRPASSPAENLTRASEGFAALATETKRDAFIAGLLGIISDAQLAAPAESTAYALLAAAHLVAARASLTGTMPTEVEARFIGFAAVALTRATRARGEEAVSPLEDAAQERFRVLRGRIRGSVFVPRDVEYAFAGQIEGLEPMALSADRVGALRKLLEEGVTKALVQRAVTALPAGEDRLKAASQLEKAARANQLPVAWEDEDVAFMRAVVERQAQRPG